MCDRANCLVGRDTGELNEIAQLIGKQQGAAAQVTRVRSSDSAGLAEVPAVVIEVRAVGATGANDAISDQANRLRTPAAKYHIDQNRVHVNTVAQQMNESHAMIGQGDVVDRRLLDA